MKRLNKKAMAAVMQPLIEEGDLEATAIRIVRYVGELDMDEESLISTAEYMLIRAMRNSWHTARTRYEWTRIVNAVDSDYLKQLGEKREKTAYRRLVTLGVVRSYKHSRDYLYELNLDWSPEFVK